MVNQVLSFAGDEVDARYDSMLETRTELREVRLEDQGDQETGVIR